MPQTLKQALSILESGAWCSLRFITANTAKGSGGKVVELAKVRMRKHQHQPASNAVKPAVPSRSGKSPNHHEHFTRNVETQAGDIIKVHPILITHLNNQKVV